MKLSDLLPNVKTALSDIEVRGLTSDSRRVREGYAFVCVRGPLADGHDFARMALDAGASVIISERDLGIDNQITVPDTHAAFAEMCRNFFGRPDEELSIIGVTGTNGKTTVTYMLKSILERNGYKTGLIGTIRNLIGEQELPAKTTTPGVYEIYELFARCREQGCKFVVMEVSSHALDQRRVEGIKFSLALFTNLTQDHLDYHKTMENYLACKKKLFYNCEKAVINIDDPAANALTKDLSCPIIGYSAKQNADFYARDINFRPDGVDYILSSGEDETELHISTGGLFSVYNSLCAFAAASTLGVPKDIAAEGLSALSGVKGRAEVVPTGRDFTVIIDYAHTPDGLENVLKTFSSCKKGRLTVVFGCGGDRDKTKRPKMGAVAAKWADNIIVTSDNPRTEDPRSIIDDILKGLVGAKTPYEVVENRISAVKYAIKSARAGDIVLLAGKGHETYQILGTEKIHLDEREIVAQALKECQNG